MSSLTLHRLSGDSLMSILWHQVVHHQRDHADRACKHFRCVLSGGEGGHSRRPCLSSPHADVNTVLQSLLPAEGSQATIETLHAVMLLSWAEYKRGRQTMYSVYARVRQFETIRP